MSGDAVMTQSRMSLAEAAGLRFLDPAKLRFFMAGATLRLTIEGESSCLKVNVRRAFPMSHPEAYFSVRDDSGKELGMLRDPSALDAESRGIVLDELERLYVISVIQQVLASTERFGTVDWEAETSRGRVKFTTRDMRDNTITVGPGHYLVMDVENNRYEIPDIAALDQQIDALVYELYGLTDAEIRIVEGAE